MRQRKSPSKTSRKPASSKPVESGRCPLVALGASAGGLEVFQEFFDHMPTDCGMAFVVLQHLDPKHETLMPELLAKHTSMKVLRVAQGLSIKANHVYVISPNMSLEIKDCTLQVSPLSRDVADRRPIDHFFRTAAEDQGENVVGIVLSGAGSDGTMGLKAIKQNGGLTMAQAPESAKFDSMPRSAISTGFVDYVLPVKMMPQRIVEYIRHLTSLRQHQGNEALQQETLKLLPKITTLLRKHSGHDFSRYKQSTLVRRIQRRMQVVYANSPAKYVEHLRKDPSELDALFKDLLIGVTQFFRDRDAFDALTRTIVPALFHGKGKTDTVRVWVPGCATGEEAYSLAILLTEQARRQRQKPAIQVFATDLDVEALDHARKAVYPEEIADQVPSEILKRYFKEGPEGSYVVVDELRELCIFSPHNLIKDPPFSRLDLISCRNLLIYLEADVQRKLLPLFHYSLNPCGYLFLGPSENIASRSELFRTLDPKHRIFQRKPAVLHAMTPLPVMDSGRVTKFQSAAVSPLAVAREPSLARSIERVIIDEFSPPSAVINEQGDVLYFSGDTGRFFQPPAGVPTNKVVPMAHKGLRLELRTLIHRAVTSGKTASRENIQVRLGRRIEHIDLLVRPLVELGDDPKLYIILFKELAVPTTPSQPAIEQSAVGDLPVIRQLENELRTTKEDLQTTIEELETSNEELKSANEELVSMNEELQSANEELQTSKEEVQSTNDELQRKIEEVEAASAELRQAHEERARLAAIVQSSDDSIIGTTLDGVVTSWNGGAERMFGYTASEMIGKSITTIIPPDRHEEEKITLSRLRRGERVEPYETERATKAGRRLQISLTSSPIHDAQGFITGVAKIARDITERKNTEDLRSRLGAVVEFSDDAIITTTLEGVITTWNKGAEKIYGYRAEEVIGRLVTLLVPDDRPNEEPAILHRLRKGESIEHYETVRRRKDGTLVDVSLTVSPLKDASNKIVGASKVARDVTNRRRNEEAAFRLAALVESSDDAIVSKTLDSIVTSWNKAAEKMFGYTAKEIIGKPITMIFPEDRLEEEAQVIAHIRRGERVEHFETVRKTKDGRLIDVFLTVSPVRDPLGKIIGASKIARDITERKRSEKATHSVLQRLQLALAAGELGDWSWDASTDMVTLSPRAATILGLPQDKLITWTSLRDLLHEEDRDKARVAVEQSLARRSQYNIEYHVRRPSGTEAWIAAKGQGIYENDGTVRGMIGVVQDITERKQLEESRQEEARVLELLNQTGAAISSELKLETLVQHVTDAATELSGAKFGAFFYNVINEQGESFTLYTLSGAPREAFEKFGLPRNTPMFGPTFRGEGVVRCEDVLKDPRYGKMPPHHGMPAGHLPVRSYLAVPVISRSGNVIGGLFFGHPEPGVFDGRAEKLVIGVAAQAAVAIDNARLFETAQRELAQRKKTEAELQAAKDDLERRVQERTASLQETTNQLETFCYTIAHDLRSPLRAQQSFAQVLLDDYHQILDETGKEYTSRIIRNAQRLDKLVNDLLTYSRLTRTELKFEKVQLSKVVTDVLANQADEIRSRNAAVSIGPLQAVQAYEPTLNLIVTNLVSNALKFVTGTNTPQVRIESEVRDRFIRLSVIDRGIGIAPENLPKIFGVFQRLHPMDQYPGTGIGLAIVHKGVERMGGRVGVESEPGQGSRFWIELPIA